MAKKKAAKTNAAKAKKIADGEGVALKVIVEATPDTPVYYVNYFEIAHVLNEFGLFATRLPVKMSTAALAAAKAEGELHVEAEMQLVVPPTVIPGLIRALTAQKEKYEQSYGKIIEQGQGEDNGKQ